jgi:hypothetical protein
MNSAETLYDLIQISRLETRPVTAPAEARRKFFPGSDGSQKMLLTNDTNWVRLFRQFVMKSLKVFAYANNHYTPGMVPER